MARGPKKHLKRLAAPSHWMLDKLTGVFAPRPSTGPHKMRECIPLTLILRNRLKYALSRREVNMIAMRRLVQVDAKTRTDKNYPCGLMDVLTLDKSGENYRVMYDVKGRFTLHRITKEEAAYKLCKVVKNATAKKATIGRNPFQSKQLAAIPYVVTHDGRTIRYPDPDVAVNDTVKVDLATGAITGSIKFAVGNLCLVSRGANMGRIGTLQHLERHPGSFDIVHLKDRKGNAFATRLTNVMVIGEGNKPWISLPRGKGVRSHILDSLKGNKNDE